MASILALREHAPIITVIAGTVGCFGGMPLAAGLSSYIVMTREARLGLNGPEVIEQESGIEEFDSSDRALIWAINGGEQRVAMGVADELVLDDAEKIAASVQKYVKAGLPQVHRSQQVELYRKRIAALDTSRQIDPLTLRKLWRHERRRRAMSEQVVLRGKAWFQAFTGKNSPMAGRSGLRTHGGCQAR